MQWIAIVARTVGSLLVGQAAQYTTQAINGRVVRTGVEAPSTKGLLTSKGTLGGLGAIATAVVALARMDWTCPALACIDWPLAGTLVGTILTGSLAIYGRWRAGGMGARPAE